MNELSSKNGKSSSTLTPILASVFGSFTFLVLLLVVTVVLVRRKRIIVENSSELKISTSYSELPRRGESTIYTGMEDTLPSTNIVNEDLSGSKLISKSSWKIEH